MGRVATGLTLATLLLTAAVFSQDCPVLAAAFVAATVFAVIATVADRLPQLHRLPLIGAPKPAVTFKVNGSTTLTVRLRRAVNELTGERVEVAQPRTAQIEVGVHNPARQPIEKAEVNFLLPVGLVRRATQHDGSTRTDGTWMPPTYDQVAGRDGWFDYWSYQADFAGRWHGVLYFGATFKEPGEYAMRLRLGAPALYESAFDTDVKVRVELADEDGPVEQISDAITQGEELRLKLKTPQPAWFNGRTEAVAFYLTAYAAIPDDFPQGTELLNVETMHEGQRTGTEYLLSLVEQNLTTLYVVRRQVAAREGSAAN